MVIRMLPTPHALRPPALSSSRKKPLRRPRDALLLLLTYLSSGRNVAFVAAQNLPPPCDSQVYCAPGEQNLLHVVQMAWLYKDSKTFVDKPMKNPEAAVLDNFRKMMNVS